LAVRLTWDLHCDPYAAAVVEVTSAYRCVKATLAGYAGDQAQTRTTYPGIALRQLEQHDLAAWYAYLVIPQVIEHTSWNVRSAQDLVELLRSYESTAPASPRWLAIVNQDSGVLAGTIGFHSISEENRTAEVAYGWSGAFLGI
jgi:RimJ/RimL family protein N-acetyltransferase